MCQSTPSTTGVTTAPATATGCGCASHAAANSATAVTQVPEGATTVHSLKEALQVGEQVRWVAEGHDLDFPPVPFPSLRVLRSAGEETIRRIVRRHHTLLKNTAIGHLFDSDPQKFAEATERTADFIVEACGGPALYSPAQGHTCMRTRHFPFTIDESGRETWLNGLWQALADEAFPADVREEYWNWLEAMSIRMINRRTAKGAVKRFPYAWMLASTVDRKNPAIPSNPAIA